jgi:hypothetical protein
MAQGVIMREMDRKRGGAQPGGLRQTDTACGPGMGPAGFYLVSPRSAGASMAAQYQMERDRGTKESCQQLAVLREKWPLAFPVKDQDVRPLAIGAVGEIAAVMGWSIPYTLGVLFDLEDGAGLLRGCSSP